MGHLNAHIQRFTLNYSPLHVLLSTVRTLHHDFKTQIIFSMQGALVVCKGSVTKSITNLGTGSSRVRIVWPFFLFSSAIFAQPKIPQQPLSTQPLFFLPAIDSTDFLLAEVRISDKDPRGVSVAWPWSQDTSVKSWPGMHQRVSLKSHGGGHLTLPTACHGFADMMDRTPRSFQKGQEDRNLL